MASDGPYFVFCRMASPYFDRGAIAIFIAVIAFCGVISCLCWCLLRIIAYALADREGASEEEIENLPRFTFLTVQETHGGVMTQLGVDSPSERVLSADEAECCICLGEYEDGTELRELPCLHHFHRDCIEKWLRINATCPICKFSILGGHDAV